MSLATEQVMEGAIDSLYAHVEQPEPQQLRCFNGPCEGTWVDAPLNAVPGVATALRWFNVKGKPQYAVYVIVEHQGITGLMYLKSYPKPFQAVQRVSQITAVCSSGVS